MRSFEVTHFYPGRDQQRFWDMLVDPQWHSQSDLMPGEITIEEPGEGSPSGLGAVRRIKIGRIDLVEDIVAFDPPGHLGYAVRDGGMPVNKYRGDFFLEPRGDGLQFRYEGSFETRFFGTGWILERVFRSRIEKMIPTWEKACELYPETGDATVP